MQAKNAGTLTLLNKDGNGKGIFGPTWGYQIRRLRTIAILNHYQDYDTIICNT
ncbi:hypothetical protein [Microcoleus sp. B9-D4]|uniref:hypothetical protein n=1 Tax=Microcoleus sp. B9-D4 TaxID=2818711 RepID=UPI002FCE8ACB